MARVRTVDFLPEIFQTSTNREFLGATLDQLVQEPKFKKIQGFVGRRVGPGVNANDEYIKETDATRANYQLEPGVVLTTNDHTKVADAITFPGITDALGLQGANTSKADRLYSSEFYSWDPFIDFDKFVNFSQYYWLPAGPDSVNVFAGNVPSSDTFNVIRKNNSYSFSGVTGNNPTLTLVRGGSYTFNVAQNQTETINLRVTNNSTSAYVIDYQTNPNLTLVRGNTYVFNLILNVASPFYIKTQPTIGTNNIYNGTLPDGNASIINNGATNGLVTFTVPQNAPNTLYYASSTEPNMKGQLNIVDATPGTGPGFWIQAAPGVEGKMPTTPNISSRDVLGVVNNGEDLGTVTFNVPLIDAQDFYFNLPWVNNQSTAYTVDLITDLKFTDINNQSVEQFFIDNPDGIDGITNLNGRTVVFINDIEDPTAGGWQIASQFDPLPNVGDVQSGPGSYDSVPFSYTTDIPKEQRYSVWQIQYITTNDGYTYMQLNSVQAIEFEQKFIINYGTVYSSTDWYKNDQGYFEQIPLLTAPLSTLYYQDGVNPLMFGEIKLITEDQISTLDVNEIIGKKNYTSPNGVVFTNGLKVEFVGSVTPVSYQNNSYYVEGVGTAIKLLPVTNFVTPETYTKSSTVPYDSTPYDIGNYDATLNAPLVPDYLTINRASLDLNPWTRSNRWFHIDVINASAAYNNTIPVLDNNFRAKRPVIEFRAGTKLFDFGTEGKQPVNIIDFNATDALSTINGTTGYGTDGYQFINGSRVIFAADSDPQVRNKIYVVEFITPDSVPPLIAEPIINLVPAADADIAINQTVVCLSGNTLQGKSFYYDGVEWIESQQKTNVNQPPLFDVFDSSDISLGNRVKYPSTNFVGSKLFSYAQGTGTNDSVLGFPLKYLSLTNVGDIVFDNNLYKDTFTYTKDSISYTDNISIGHAQQYSSRTNYIKEIGWQTAITPTLSRQQFRFVYDGNPLLLDVKVNENNVVPAVQLFVANAYQEPNTYTVSTTDNTTTITLQKIYVPGDIIEVDVLSSQASKVGFYTVPGNLSNNPLNSDSPTFTLGTVRSHYDSICENLIALVGPMNGANNTRDLGDIIPYGTNIVQQSSPMTMAGFFMRSTEYNIFNALDYNSKEYEKFKARLLNTVVTEDYTNYTIPQMLEAAVAYMNSGKTENYPFYWSDMLPVTSIYKQTTTTVTPISTNVFSLSTTYDFTSSNYQSVLVYVNDVLLQYGYDYTVSANSPTLTISIPLATGDVVVIQEYESTIGNFVPNTPTKLGLYPAFRPEIYYDTTYINPCWVIQGHDGSKTVAFGDFRDQLLLEFETRIYNNLKVKSAIPLTAADVIPGQFRTTDYTLSEVNAILAPEFLSWVGWNKLDYKTQDFIASNEFTWNYSACGNKLTGTTDILKESPLYVGAWRGIYRYFYDTDYPNTRPWEMLGFSEKPSWWEQQYGPAPYTSGNMVLWDDLAAGYVNDPMGGYYRPQYARPRLTEVPPVDSEGNLLSPIDSVVGLYDSSQFQKSWTFGDGGPVEATWFKSSSYPFAIMRLLALTRPAEFFSLFADRDLYKFDTDFNQYLYNGRYRLDANNIQVYGNGVSKASFIDWIIDYNQQLGQNSSSNLTTSLSNLDVRLCYRVGSFTDKRYLKIYTEKSSPNSLNSSLLLPEESYDLLIYKNQPFEQVVFSSIIVQIVQGGYAVLGYSITNPYFEILASRAAGTKTTISAGGSTVTVPNQYSDTVVQVPYGYVFTNQAVVVDFILSYGALLERQGMSFQDQENGKVLNWSQMAQEFLYWANQGWAVGSVINLNPNATSATAVKEQAIVDSLVIQTPENLILDQNRTNIPVRDLVVDRFENTFIVKSLNEQTINYLDLKYTSYETLVVLNNKSIFNDLIYDPATGARQSRVNVIATVSADWNGQLDAQGFILNNNKNVEEWKPNRKYAKGEIVIYKNNYWSAQTIVQPKVKFDYSDWVKSDYTKIQGGLLNNIALKADQLADSYDVYRANLNSDQDLLSFGLIGFRPRQYMTALNLDDVSQVGVYQQFIKDAGTVRAIRLLGNANLSKEVADYTVYENWAVQQSVYGANANRSFIELRLNEADLDSNPSTVQIIQTGETSSADQSIYLNNLWRESYKLPNTSIFPTTTVSPTDIALPTAGYVDLNDVDVTVFSLLGNLGFAPGVLETIGVGTTIWAAKSNSWDWNIYRCSGIPGRVTEISSNLNATCTVTFSKPHGLATNDVIIIRMLDSVIDGVYKVENVVNATQITISLTISNTVTGDGVAYYLQTQRVAQASDVYNLPYVNSLLPGARVWIDNNSQGLWEVIEKQSPFARGQSISATTPDSNAQFGASVAQSTNNLFALIGSPTYSTSGGVYTYLKNEFGEYAEHFLLELDTTGTSNFGNVVKIGNKVWCAAGANTSNSNYGYATVIRRPNTGSDFILTQLLVSPDQDFTGAKFGTSIAISNDERWMYIGAPGTNKVYAFGRVDIEDQYVKYTTTTSVIYDYYQNITVDQPTQLTVLLNNQLLTYGVDYTTTGNSVVLTAIPAPGLPLVISRKLGQQIDHQTYYNVEQDSATGGGSGAKFIVGRTRGTYSVTLTAGGTGYNIGDVLTINATTIGGGSNPANNLTITVTNVSGGAILEFTKSGSGVSNTSSFNIGTYLYTVSDMWSFSIEVNGTLQRPYIDYSYNAGTTTVTFINNPPAGAIINVRAETYFDFVDTLTVPGLAGNAEFGFSVSTTTDGRQVFIGCPNDSTGSFSNDGSVYVFDRNVIKQIITNPSQLVYSIPAGSVGPISVLLNNTFLKDATQFINGDYTVDLGANTVTLSSNLTLNVGDTLVIENNIFNQVQKIVADAQFESGLFGYAVDICADNDELYIGKPGDGAVRPEAGSVDVQVNQGANYGVITSTVANPSLTIGDTIRINNYVATVPSDNTVTGFATSINNSGIPNIVASTANGFLTITIINKNAADEDYVNVLPGVTGTAFDDLGFEPWQWIQNITSPNPVTNANFGASVFMDVDYNSLVVGAPNGNIYEPVIFDSGKTYFDDHSTIFSDTAIQSGAVYTYDWLGSTSESLSNPGHFVFGQQIYDQDAQRLDQWGAALDYTSGRLLVGAPGSDLGDSSVNYGRVRAFDNPAQLPAWTTIRQQTPVGDVELINSVYMFDKLENTTAHYFDFINPLQGKILGAASRNIDFISVNDPAKYNTGTVNNNGNYWSVDRVGQIWWDITNTRFIDPSQDDITYASRRWSQLFPGSHVDVYQWVESSVPPAQYTGPGTPYSTTSYTIKSNLTVQGTFQTRYYFWVTGIDTINTGAGKTLSTTGITRYIESPQSSGIPYVAILNANTLAIYNGLEFISASDTILHVEYDRVATDDAIHTEYELVADGKSDSFITGNLYRKLQDSFCGVNNTGAIVPDPALSPPERYGVQFRPRQSMFVDRFGALKNYLTRANSIIASYPIIEKNNISLLYSSDPEPTAASGEWNKRLATIEELSYQDLALVPVGYKYLIASDSTNNGLWTIYTVIAGNLVGSKTTQLTRVQNYDTRKYWYTIDWYDPGYNRTIVPIDEVPNYAGLATLSVPVGSSVKVTSNAQGKWEIYLLTETGWSRVGLQNGTLQFSETLWNYPLGRFGFDIEVFDAQYFDQEPVIETRKIIQAINEQIFINELAIERNQLLMLVFEYILSESTNPEWLMKTSLIDVVHNIRQLIPYQIYRHDNQDFVLNYIQEVKPYHVQIREFNLVYNGADDYLGTLTDFDLPAYYDTNLLIPQYVSPILLPYTQSSAVGTGRPNNNSDTPSNSSLWTTLPYNEWFNNYTLQLDDVVIIDGGTGYTTAPTLTVVGEATVPAELTAIINSAGQIVGVTIVNPGSGYITTPSITITGTGTGAKIVPVMGNGLVRSFNVTLKYDRYQYTSNIVDWTAGTSYTSGTQVRYFDQVWQAISSVPATTEFNPDYWTSVSASSLSGIDRTQGFYAPTANEPGRQLSLLIDGIDYPGVQVFGPLFSQNTGFDVGNYDINPYDNISYGPEGRPTYDPAILDAIYESYYQDLYLGTRPTDINVDGGAYIDTYESHAPEELIPGAEFDTLDLRVYTTPGADWTGNGHGMPINDRRIIFNSLQPTVSFAGLLTVPMVVMAFNVTTGRLIEPTAYNWVDYELTLGTGASDGNIIEVIVAATGGGNQLMSQSYLGNDITSGGVSSIIIPFPTSSDPIPPANSIYQFVIYNGQTELIDGVDYTFAAYTDSSTKITFTNTYGATDRINLTALGYAGSGTTHSWSLPVFQRVMSDGSASITLDNSIQGTNPINLIVTVNGFRARPSEGVRYIANGSTVTYDLPDRGGYSQGLISNNDVSVYINQTALVLGVGFNVDPYDGSSLRTVTLTQAPAAGDVIEIAVRTAAQYWVVGNTLSFVPGNGLMPTWGDMIDIITWNDPSEQGLLTQVFVGPEVQGTIFSEGFDTTDFSPDAVNNGPGSFDYSVGEQEKFNVFETGTVITNPDRNLVSIDGRFLFNNQGYTVSGSKVIIQGPAISPEAVVAITDLTQSVVPGPASFRIFQDMRGVQATYRMTPKTTTTLAEPLGQYDDIIYVTDASALSEPDLTVNIWGVITIDGERIMYRERDTVNNTVSSLLRGTAGTAAASHSTGAIVYDMGRGNLLPLADQNYVVSNTTLADGSTTVFTASDINLLLEDSTIRNESVEVYVGGILQTSGYTVTNDNPAEVTFTTAPIAGSDVTILVRRGVWWYDTAVANQSLQETDTQAAKFLRGEI